MSLKGEYSDLFPSSESGKHQAEQSSTLPEQLPTQESPTDQETQRLIDQETQGLIEEGTELKNKLERVQEQYGQLIEELEEEMLKIYFKLRELEAEKEGLEESPYATIGRPGLEELAKLYEETKEMMDFIGGMLEPEDKEKAEHWLAEVEKQLSSAQEKINQRKEQIEKEMENLGDQLKKLKKGNPHLVSAIQYRAYEEAIQEIQWKTVFEKAVSYFQRISARNNYCKDNLSKLGINISELENLPDDQIAEAANQLRKKLAEKIEKAIEQGEIREERDIVPWAVKEKDKKGKYEEGYEFLEEKIEDLKDYLAWLEKDLETYEKLLLEEDTKTIQEAIEDLRKSIETLRNLIQNWSLVERKRTLIFFYLLRGDIKGDRRFLHPVLWKAFRAIREKRFEQIPEVKKIVKEGGIIVQKGGRPVAVLLKYWPDKKGYEVKEVYPPSKESGIIAGRGSFYKEDNRSLWPEWLQTVPEETLEEIKNRSLK